MFLMGLLPPVVHSSDTSKVDTNDQIRKNNNKSLLIINMKLID